jgi:hypothetical protein
MTAGGVAHAHSLQRRPRRRTPRLRGRRGFTSNVTLAIASLRRDDAAPELLRIVETGNEALAVQALVALRSSGRLERTDVIGRARAIVEARRSRALREIIDAHATARR